MLVLRRNSGEGFTIGADIHVVYLGNGRIGIDAPRDILILRDELYRERYGESPAPCESPYHLRNDRGECLTPHQRRIEARHP